MRVGPQRVRRTLDSCQMRQITLRRATGAHPRRRPSKSRRRSPASPRCTLAKHLLNIPSGRTKTKEALSSSDASNIAGSDDTIQRTRPPPLATHPSAKSTTPSRTLQRMAPLRRPLKGQPVSRQSRRPRSRRCLRCRGTRKWIGGLAQRADYQRCGSCSPFGRTSSSPITLISRRSRSSPARACRSPHQRQWTGRCNHCASPLK